MAFQFFCISFSSWIFFQTTIITSSLCDCWYLTDAMAFRRLEWHVRAEEATMAFWGSSSGTISNWGNNIRLYVSIKFTRSPADPKHTHTHCNGRAITSNLGFSVIYDGCLVKTTATTACVRWYLWTCSSILDLAGVQALLVGVFHAGKDSRAAEAHRVDGTLIMEQHPVCDDLRSSVLYFFTGQCAILCVVNLPRHYESMCAY